MKVDLIQGDCLEKMKDIPDNSVDCIITDIPYLVSLNNHLTDMKDRKGRTGIDFGKWDFLCN